MSKKNLTITLLRVILGGVFIFSAISKLIAPGLFEITIVDQGIIESREIAAYLGRLLITFELFLGIALLQSHYLKRIVLPATLLTLISFTILLFYSYFSGDNNNCGCFGELIKMSPIEAIIKNVVLIIIASFLFLTQKYKTGNIYILLLILIISFSTVFIIAPIKSYDDLIFSKYTNFENEGRVDLSEGNKLVAIFFIDCEHCLETASNISKLESETTKLNNFYILFSGEETDSVKTFLDATNIEHPYLRIKVEELFDLIGSAPPRIYWLQNGEVKEYWDKDFISNIERYKKYFLE